MNEKSSPFASSVAIPSKNIDKFRQSKTLEFCKYNVIFFAEDMIKLAIHIEKKKTRAQK